MLIALIGESCVGKSTVADALRRKAQATVFTGKDYLKLAKSEPEARAAFVRVLADAAAASETTVYVISEPEQLALLPDGATRVLMTAELEEIQRRFAQRMHGVLPPPVAAMLARKHGMFDDIACDVRFRSGVDDADALVARLAGR